MVNSNSKVQNYHVVMANVPKWKMNAIAQYKRSKYLASTSTSSDTGRSSNTNINNTYNKNLPKNISKENSESSMINLKQAANEIIRLRKEENDLKQEYNTLNTTKTTLLWLLQKSTSYERHQNHTLS